MPVVRTDGRSVGHVITKFSGIGRFIYPWCSASALRARSSAIANAAIDESFCVLDEKPTKQFTLEKQKKNLTAVVFNFEAAVQEQDNIKTQLKLKMDSSRPQVRR